MEQLDGAFRDLYHETYGISSSTPRRSTTSGPARDERFHQPWRCAVEVGNAAAARTGERMVVFPSAGPEPVSTSLFDRSRLVPGDQLAGPRAIAAPESTIVVPPDTHLEIDTFGTILLTLK